MTPVRWSRLSREDLNNVVDRQLDTDFETADGLLEEAAKATILLASSPRAGAPAGAQDRRKWRLGKYPYVVLYYVDTKRVLILRVIHNRSDWQSLP